MSDVRLAALPKIDCHCHVFDPEAFPYAAGVAYRPAGGEIGSAAMLAAVHAAHGIHHALLVQPNSGYDRDNACLLDAIARSGGRFKGIAIVDAQTRRDELLELKARGIVGVAHNLAMLGSEAYAGHDVFWERLAELGLFVQVQVRDEQMVALAPRLRGCGAQVLVDHHGRPDLSAGLQGAGFQALLALADTGRCTVKLSGFDKFSRQPWPFDDARPFTQALIERFGTEHCVWASDWPHLRAVRRLDTGPLLALFADAVPDLQAQRQILWDTPRRLFGFGQA